MGRRPVSIAFITSLPRWGGGEKWMLQAAQAMDGRGHRVCLVGQPGGEITRRAAASGLTVRPLRMGGIAVPWTIAALRRILQRERVEVACVNQDREVHLTALASIGMRGLRLVPRRGSPDPIKGKPFYRYSYARRVDRLIVNCRALGDPVCARAPWFDRSKLRVIHNGIDVAACAAAGRRGRLRAELGIAPERLVVALVGEVGWRKGQAVLLEAAARLATARSAAVWAAGARGPESRGERHGGGVPAVAADPKPLFLIVGEGDGRADLEDLACTYGLADGAVRFLGFRDDVPDILADTDLLVLPSFQEGFPNSLLEGMAHGLPIVATTVDGIPELIDHGRTGLLVPPGDAEALARAIGSLLADPGRRRALGEAGRARAAAEFGEDRMLDAIEACLTEWGATAD
jgi:glycosyltransferase involved in cell wall biosynthesis